MDVAEDDDDLKLIKASAHLLSDLETSLPRLLWRRSKDSKGRGRVHSQVRQKDLDHVIGLIEPFQGEPQLLDARLKHIVPPIVQSYLEYLSLPRRSASRQDVDLQSAVCIVLYTLCKVRGQKVIVGFLNNEPGHFEAILVALEQASTETVWQVPYVLLLWVSHLLLTPFDLATISNTQPSNDQETIEDLPAGLPPLTQRVLATGFKYLPTSTKSQGAAASMLVRLVTRPDMQALRLADPLVDIAIKSIEAESTTGITTTTIYDRLGPLRFLSGVVSSADLAHLVPSIFRATEKLANDESSLVSSNAVTKKVFVKIFRNTAILSLRAGSTSAPLLEFLQKASVLEDVIDYLLRSLGDRDTPVRFAAAKAISLIILELDQQMGHEIIEAVLDMFKEDMPRRGAALDFRTVNPLKWHGLTLALSHTVFKRSAATEQLQAIVDALVSALQFQQQTATGSVMGTNVRDAANFGVWSLSRRYTTSELLDVDIGSLQIGSNVAKNQTVIKFMAIQLILSACFDPAGNIRRGSSAALQELVGRHADQVHDGIALVQIIDYQAVGLRRRAMVDVAKAACKLHQSYWTACLQALLGWRGLGSADVLSREAAASSLAELSQLRFDEGNKTLRAVLERLLKAQSGDVEDLHGLVSSLSMLLDIENDAKMPDELLQRSWSSLQIIEKATRQFTPRLLKSELPSAVAHLMAVLCRIQLSREGVNSAAGLDSLEVLTERLLQRHEDSVLQILPSLVRNMFALRLRSEKPISCIEQTLLVAKVNAAATRNTLHEAGRAIALGALAAGNGDGPEAESAITTTSTLAALVNAPNVEWRIIGIKAIRLVVEAIKTVDSLPSQIAEVIVNAVHIGMNDYTVDERGDIGSLVRLQAISCASQILTRACCFGSGSIDSLHGDIFRLSLEKLDRVRVAAAQCRHQFLDFLPEVNDISSTSSYSYFIAALQPLVSTIAPEWQRAALLEGIISSAGVSAEPLLQASRSALLHLLSTVEVSHLHTLLTLFSSTLKTVLLERPSSTNTANQTPSALSLLAFLLDMGVFHRLLPASPAEPSPPTPQQTFKWLTLLSTIQKSHHKSAELPRLLAAVQVYHGLADIPATRGEVLKKLASMVRTNPYPRVRVAAAEVLYVCTAFEPMLGRDWASKASEDGKKVLEAILVDAV